MKGSFSILAVLLGFSACAARQLDVLDREAAANDAGTGGAGGAALADARGSEAGAADVGVVRQPLCDGVAHLRLWVAFVGGGPGPPRVKTENGYAPFGVDGTCTYFVGGGWAGETFAADTPLRTGKLSEEDARLLEESIPLDDVTGLASRCSQNGIPDAPVRSIRAVTGTVICSQGADALFDPAWNAVKTVAARVAKEGTPVSGPLHVITQRTVPVGTVVTYPWPSSLALDDFVRDHGDLSKAGVSRLVDDLEAARQLRVARDQYVADKMVSPGLHPGDGPLVTDPSGMAWVYMRDAIPYEDAQGLVAF